MILYLIQEKVCLIMCVCVCSCYAVEHRYRLELRQQNSYEEKKERKITEKNRLNIEKKKPELESIK